MRYFFSVGEPSGDLHGANLLAALRSQDPQAEFLGFGGPKMADQGLDLLFELANYPIMGILSAVQHIPMLKGLVKKAAKTFQQRRPDAVVLIDYPGFNWHVAKAAKAAGIPVIYYVPPQIWAWASWRITKVRKWIDYLLCSLPFEPAWYHKRGVPQAEYVGHPFFDDLAHRQLDAKFLEQQRSAGRRIVALLPGSRTSEVRANFLTLVHTADRLHRTYPSLRFLVGAFKEKQRELMADPLASRSDYIEAHVGKTPEIMSLADAAIAVSGSVGLELMSYRTPTAVVFRVPWLAEQLYRRLVTCKYISLVNLLADRVVFPEFPGSRDFAPDLTNVIGGWLDNEASRLTVVAQLDELVRRHGQPGAGLKAARRIVEIASSRKSALRVAS